MAIANRWYRCAQPPANRCNASGVWNGISGCATQVGTSTPPYCLELEAVLNVCQIRRLAIASLLNEFAGKEVRVADQDVLVRRQMEVDHEVEFVPHVVPR